MKNLLLIIGLTAIIQVSAQLPTLIDSNNQIIKYDGYTISYNELHEQPNWVFYRMDSTDIICGAENKAKRKNNFKEDKRIRTGSASLKDYKGSGYDRGHLKSSADESCNQAQMNETFYMSNMSPQLPALNRGGWKKLENYVRKLTKTNDSLYVYTGPVLNPTLKTIGENKVSVPLLYFKVVYVFNNSDKKVISYLIPNNKITEELNTYRIELTDLEKLIGITFPKSF